MKPIGGMMVESNNTDQVSYLVSRNPWPRDKEICNELKRGKKRIVLVDKLSVTGGIAARKYFYDKCKVDIEAPSFPQQRVVYKHNHSEVLSAVATDSDAPWGAVWDGFYKAKLAEYRQDLYPNPLTEVWPLDVLAVAASLGLEDVDAIKRAIFEDAVQSILRNKNYFPSLAGIARSNRCMSETLDQLRLTLKNAPFVPAASSPMPAREAGDRGGAQKTPQRRIDKKPSSS